MEGEISELKELYHKKNFFRVNLLMLAFIVLWISSWILIFGFASTQFERKFPNSDYLDNNKWLNRNKLSFLITEEATDQYTYMVDKESQVDFLKLDSYVRKDSKYHQIVEERGYNLKEKNKGKWTLTKTEMIQKIKNSIKVVINISTESNTHIQTSL